MSETYPIFDADGMPHFPFGDEELLICYDCKATWPCPTAAEYPTVEPAVSGV